MLCCYVEMIGINHFQARLRRCLFEEQMTWSRRDFMRWGTRNILSTPASLPDCAEKRKKLTKVSNRARAQSASAAT